MSDTNDNALPEENIAFNYSDSAQQHISLVGIKYASKSEVDTVIDTLRGNSNIRSIDLTNVNMSAQWLSDVIDTAATCPNLESLILSGNTLHQAASASLCAALPHWPKLHTLECDSSGIDSDGCQQLCAALKGRDLKVLCLRGNKIGTEGIEAITQTLPTLPKLKKLLIANCGIDDDLFPPLAEQIAIHPTLVDSELFFNHMSDAQQDAFLELLQQHHNRNLIEPSSTHPPLTTFQANNKQRASTYTGKLKDFHEGGSSLSAMQSHDICAMAERLPALESLLSTPEAMQNLTDFLADLPIAGEDITHDALFTADARGLTPLDNPATWQQISSICETLERQGTPLTTEDLLQPNKDGNPYLLTALAGTPETVLPRLNEHGIHTPVSALLSNQTPTPLFNQLCKDDAAALLFTTDNLRGESARAISALHKALPEAQQDSVSNYHALIATLSSENRQHGAGR